MGKMKEQIQEEKRRNGQPVTAVEHMLEDNGFHYSRMMCRGGAGWERTFSTDSGLYTVWACCSMERRTLYIYKEYECGGEVCSSEIPMPEDVLEEDGAEAFLDWLDSEVENYM